MGTIANILEDWATTDPAKTNLISTEKGKVVRWINEAQLRFADRSECLQGVWQPTITSTGNIALPSDFKREIKNKVKWRAGQYLMQIDYPSANVVSSWSNTTHYSIWNNTFYVWGAGAGTPSIPYIKNPTAVTVATLSSADSQLPGNYLHNLFLYLDSMWARQTGDTVSSIALLKQFDQSADDAYTYFIQDTQVVPMMRGGFF